VDLRVAQLQRFRAHREPGGPSLLMESTGTLPLVKVRLRRGLTVGAFDGRARKHSVYPRPSMVFERDD